MTLFVRIVDGAVESIGALPVRARRLDTGELVNPADRLKACGFFDVAAVTLADLPADLTPQQRQAIIGVVQEVRQRRQRRADFLEDLRADAGAFKSQAWDWLDRFGTPPVPGSPNAGVDWGPLSQANKAEALRAGETWGFRGLIAVVDTVLLMIDALAPLLDAADFDPPDPR